MRDLRTLSGPWTGFWIQQMIRGTMRLTLRFGEGTIDGGGRDRDGSFSIHGSFSDDTRRVQMVKRYHALSVIYNGTWDDPMIHGTSDIAMGLVVFDHGAFEIWPEGEEESVETLAVEEAPALPAPTHR